MQMGIKAIPLLIAAVLSVSLMPDAAVHADTFAEAEIPARCIVSRAVPEEYRDFTYVLEAESEDCPMPDGSHGMTKTVHMKKSGKIEFGKISFDHPEVYIYTVKETTPERGKLRRDHNVYAVSLMADSKGRVRIAVKNDSGEKQEEIVFRNRYRGETGGYGSPKMGDDERLFLWFMVLCSGAAIALAVIERQRRRIREREMM